MPNFLLNKFRRVRINAGLIKDALLFSFIIFLCAIILCIPQASAAGVKLGLRFCTNTLVPALFPFMMLSSLVVKIGMSEKIGKVLAPVVKVLFRLPPITAATILLSFVGGYPSGAIGVNELYRQGKISRAQAEQMLLFTVCAGPAFILNAVCSGFANNAIIGPIMLASHIISALILGIVAGFLYSPSKLIGSAPDIRRQNFSYAMVGACLDAAHATFNMCSFVILFSALLSILNQSHIFSSIFKILDFFGVPPAIINIMLPAALEVTNGCSAILKNRAPTELLAFALSWAGVCVHFQIFSIAESINFSKLKFIFFRATHGLLAVVISHFLFSAFSARSAFATITRISSSSVAEGYVSKGSVALIALCVIFLLTANPRTTRGVRFEKPKKRRLNHVFKK